MAKQDITLEELLDAIDEDDKAKPKSRAKKPNNKEKKPEEEKKKRMKDRRGFKEMGWFYWVTLPVRVIWRLIKSVFKTIHAFVITLVTLFLIGCICVGLLYYKYTPQIDEVLTKVYDVQASIQKGDFKRGEDTYIYDVDGNTIGIANAGYFEYVDIAHIGENLQNLYISQEDKRFKTHFGIDPIGILRAAVSLYSNNGEITQGGSTLTQQLIKNVYLTQERSFERKIVEILVAPRLEITFSKPKIMEFYCNTNYYANRCYGVQAASEYYFDKNASDLSIAQAALLVGISNAPSRYDPVDHPEDALEKRNSVIKKAYKNGFITEEEQNEALEEPMNIVRKPFAENMETYGSTYAIHCAALAFMEKDNFHFQYVFKNKADYDAYMEKYGEAYTDATEEVRSGGYTIRTSINPAIQNIAQTQLDEALSKFTELQDNGKYAMQGSVVVCDNKTGYVVAVIGGRGTEDQFNRTYLMARQPGSTIKPLIAYAPAFDTLDYYPAKTVNDHKWEGGPSNSGGKYYGDITIRQALNRSLNTVAWQVLDDIGVSTGLEYLGKMKFQKLSYIDWGVNALAIGGFTNGTRPVDMAKGYQTLANGGQFDNKTCIVSIEDTEGNIVYDGNKAGREKVYEPDTAYMITDILKGTFTAEGATAHGLSLNDMACAGKTGTTNASKDTWFCGYTPYYTTAVWIGYDTPRDMPGTYGRDYAGHIWQNVMNTLHEGIPFDDWERPESVIEKSVGGIEDLYSTASDTRAAQVLDEQRKERIFLKAEEAVRQYETKTVASVEDTYHVEDDYIAAKNSIAEVEEADRRQLLAERIETKHNALAAIVNDMQADIEFYEARKEHEEQAAEDERNRQAEEERKAQILEKRQNDVDEYIEQLLNMEYRPDDIEDIVQEAEVKLSHLLDEDCYEEYAESLAMAIEHIADLPDYEEYLVLKEEEEHRKKIEEEAAKKRAAEELRRAKEQAAIETQTNYEAQLNGGQVEPAPDSTVVTEVPAETQPETAYVPAGPGETQAEQVYPYTPTAPAGPGIIGPGGASGPGEPAGPGVYYYPQ